MTEDRLTTVAFTGHRTYGGQAAAALRATVGELYARGFRTFLCGMAMGCDLYFCEAVLELRSRHPDVTVEAAIPCPTQSDAWPADQRERYRRLVKACDFETVVSQQYSASCMQRRDRYMVDHAALLIAVHDGQPGGTRRTIEYAMRRRLDVVILPPVENEKET